jgi:MFS superfamily sulfate permease-like transporter
MKFNHTKKPAEGFQGLKENFKADAMSGFLISILALPLSLGIAKASDFPPIFGLVTAIIGGIVVSFLSGSRLTIKGPAAGLIVIASGSVAAFGGGETGWHLTLGAIVVAGMLQILFGLLKLGKLADFFPGAAVHGMLAAIGIIIISKQIHLLMGIDPATLNGKEPLELLSMIPASITHENAHLTEIGIACLAILTGFSFVKNKKIKKIPAPLIVLIVAIPLGYVLHVKDEAEIHNFALVKVGSLIDVMSEQAINVDFSGMRSQTGTFVEYVILFALIGTLESLLTAKAIDDLDPYQRKSNFNKDLTAIGIGNTISGILGGLPMISEVARSSANVENGAVTRWSNFFHGVFLLIALLVGVKLIEMIPNAALAAMLIFVGFKLTHPKEFIHMWRIGIDQFIIFVATVIITISTDLLIGVGSGIILEIIINLIHGTSFMNLFYSKVSFVLGDNDIQVNISGDAVFSNLIGIKKKLYYLPPGKNVTLNLSELKVCDHSTLHLFSFFKNEYEGTGGKLQITGLENHKAIAKSPTSTRKIKKDKKIQLPD